MTELAIECRIPELVTVKRSTTGKGFTATCPKYGIASHGYTEVEAVAKLTFHVTRYLRELIAQRRLDLDAITEQP